ncbi:hypothetical protein ACIBG8_37540 [Nonomuraea sp. NPDC050556]|uniref:hypothetical protein n=1 Tax=Nonomuraea sp. NPDC050556 TaxID=3364369 RepID=UPI0037AED519
MRAGYTQQVEAQQIQQLEWVQQRLTSDGQRSLLVRHVRLTLAANRYDPLERVGPLLIAGSVRVRVENGYHVQLEDGRSAHFMEVDETADYVRRAMTSSSSGGSTTSPGKSSGANQA